MKRVLFSIRKERMDPQTELLLQKSALDEETLQLERLPLPIVGFHAQQAVEKLLKALLAERGVRYKRTHDIEVLTEDLTAVGETLPFTPFPLADLSDYAADFRYQDPLPPHLDRETVLATVRIIREFVCQRIAEIDQPS